MVNQLNTQVFIDASSKNQIVYCQTKQPALQLFVHLENQWQIHHEIHACADTGDAWEIIISTYQNAAGVREGYGIWKNAFLVPLV